MERWRSDTTPWSARPRDPFEIVAPTIEGSAEPHRNKVGRITKDQIRGIAEKKLDDLNAHDLDQASKIIEGTARSMGVEVV